MLILCENKISNTQFNRKINEKVSEKLGFFINFSMFYVYYLDILSDLTESEFSIVKKLLLSDKLNINGKNQNYFLVAPRPGVETSWGTKAKDIFYASGLNKLKSIEQAKLYVFDHDIDSNTMNNSSFCTEFFDKMT